MTHRRTLAALAVALALAACAEPTGPPERPEAPALGSVIGPGVPESQMHFLSHRLKLSADGRATSGVLWTSAEGSEAYSLSFWVVQGQEKAITVDYAVGGESAAGRFLELQFPAGALYTRPDGSAIVAGDSVRVTVDISNDAVVLRFGPSGLVFSPSSPPRMDVWYGGTQFDAASQTSLGIWYEQESGDPWYPLASGHDTAELRLTTLLMHFSNYSISW